MIKNKKNIIIITIAAFITAVFISTGNICSAIRSIATILMMLAALDIILSRWSFGFFDLAHRVGFKKFSYIAPYALLIIGGIIISITEGKCLGLFW